MKSQDKKDANGNVIKDSEGKAMVKTLAQASYNYVKHIHFKAFDNKDKKTVQLLSFQTLRHNWWQGVLSSTKDFNPFIALDS